MSESLDATLCLPIEARFAEDAGVKPISSFIWDQAPALVDVDGHCVAVYELGPEDGIPLLSFHGNPGSGRGPHPTPALLEAENVRLIAFDAPAFGGSQPVSTNTPFVSAANAAKGVVEALGHDKVAVWARSGGVPRALGFAALHQEYVSNMVLVAPLAPPTANIDWQAGMTPTNNEIFTVAQETPQLVCDQLSSIVEGLMRDKYYHFREHLWPEINVFDKLVFDLQPDLYVSTAAGHAAGVRQNPTGWAQHVTGLKQPWGFNPSDVQAPTLIIHGRHDPYTGIEHARWLHRHIRGAKLLEIEGGHFANWLQVRRQLVHLRERHVGVGSDTHAAQNTTCLETSFSLRRSFENYVH